MPGNIVSINPANDSQIATYEAHDEKKTANALRQAHKTFGGMARAAFF